MIILGIISLFFTYARSQEMCSLKTQNFSFFGEIALEPVCDFRDLPQEKVFPKKPKLTGYEYIQNCQTFSY